MPSFSNTDLEYMFWTGIRNGSIGTIGTKGDPGGFTVPTFIGGTTDLNTLLTPGLYEAPGGNVDSVRNYPLTFNAPFAMKVTRSSGTTGQQEAEFHFTSKAGQVVYRRTWSSSGTVWTAWKAFNATRVDQTAGRAIYQWDDLNNREQLIYGDTGWRNITSSIINGWVAVALQVRRIGYTVYLRFYQLDPAAATSTTFVNLPAGFRVSVNTSYGAIEPSGVVGAVQLIDTTGAAFLPTTRVYGQGLYVEINYSTLEAWPATLPGTASGTIPNL